MRKGDTLIEVAIAIAIFSLVAIGVVSVINGSTSTSQSALEVTVTREEMDAQAEALRFIHTSYIAGGKANAVGNDKYQQLWEKIAGRAEHTASEVERILDYNPATCRELYDASNQSNIFDQKAFIVNTHTMGNTIDFASSSVTTTAKNTFLNNTIVSRTKNDNGDLFRQATTYPRLLYRYSNDEQLLDTSGQSAGTNASTYYNYDTIAAAEGIFVVGVKDQRTTAVVSGSGIDYRASAFYDFYIRTCWFAPGADKPSTISTVVRLQDPAAVEYESGGTEFNRVAVDFYSNDGTGDSMRVWAEVGATVGPIEPFSRSGYTFVGWSRSSSASSPTYNTTQSIPVTGATSYYAVWKRATGMVTVTFNSNGGYGTMANMTVPVNTEITPANGFSRSGYTFAGWSTNKNATSGTIGPIRVTGTMTLYAIWRNNSSISTEDRVLVRFYENDGSKLLRSVWVEIGTRVMAYTPYYRYGYAFSGWSRNRYATSATYLADRQITITTATDFYAVWKAELPIVSYNANGGTGGMEEQVVSMSGGYVSLLPNQFTRSGYIFMGWSTNRYATQPMYNERSYIQVYNSMTLYAVWMEWPKMKNWNIRMYWYNYYYDYYYYSFNLDSNLYGSNLSNSYFTLSPSNTTVYYFNGYYTNNQVMASLSQSTSYSWRYGNYNEIETISASLPVGKTYYYYVYIPPCNNGRYWYCYDGYAIFYSAYYYNQIYVNVNGSRYYLHNASGFYNYFDDYYYYYYYRRNSGLYWNVFKIQNGRIYSRQTITTSPETWY